MYYGTDMDALNFGVNRSQFKVTVNNICWIHHCRSGGIQHSTSCVELDFLVVFFQSYTSLGRVPRK